MKKEFLGSLLAILAAAGGVFAQTVTPASPVGATGVVAPLQVPDVPPLPAPAATPPAPPVGESGRSRLWSSLLTTPNTCPRMWGSGEYLLWWFKDGPLSAPLLTGAPAGTPNAGVL